MKKLSKLFLTGVLSISMFAVSFIGVSASEKDVDPQPLTKEELQEKYNEAYQQDAELIEHLNKNMDKLLAEGREESKLDTEKGAYV